MLPNELPSSRALRPFTVQERDVDHWTKVHYEAIYTGRVVWADSDHWEWPDWMSDYLKELRASYPNHDISTVSGDKGWVEIYFRRRNP